jgi:hypothetical protein
MRRAILLALLLLGGIAVVVTWLQQRQAAERRLWTWEAEQHEDAVTPRWQKQFDWQRADLTLAEFTDLVAAKSGLEVVIDDGNIRPARVQRLNSAAIMRVPEGRFRLDALLSMVLAPHQIYAEPHEQKLYFTTDSGLNADPRRTAVYPLPLRDTHGLDEADWVNVISGNVSGEALAVPGAVVVYATAREQRRVRFVFDAVKNLEAAAPNVLRTPIPSITEDERAITDALERPADVAAVEMPLKDVMHYLTERYAVPLILYAHKLEEASVSLDTPITKKLRGLSLRSLLRLILKDLELTYVVREGAIFITTPDDAESKEATVAYAVSDLEPVSPPGELHALPDIIPACIRPDSWGFSGPSGIALTDHGWLIFRQTSDVHEQVAALLQELRECLNRPEQFGSVSVLQNAKKEAEFRAALDQPIALDVKGIPLKDIVLYFHEALNVPIMMSAKKMEEASVSQDTPVTIDLPRAAARQQLEAVLLPLQLDFVIRDEVLQITTTEDVESQLDVRIYDARHLAADAKQGDELREEILETVLPRSWDTTGGPGNVEVFRNLLIVSQTRRGHEALEQFLKLRSESPQGTPPLQETAK